MESFNCNGLKILKQSGLDIVSLRKRDSHNPTINHQKFWQLAVEKSGQETFGIRAAEFLHIGSLYGLGFSWLSSENLLDALNRLIRFRTFLSSAFEATIEKKGNEWNFILKYPELDKREPVPASIDFSIALVIQMCRLSITPQFTPLEVYFEHDTPKNVKPFNDFFGGEVYFSSNKNMLVFDQEQIDQPFPYANSELARANDKIVINYLSNFKNSSIGLAVREKIIDKLPSGPPAQIEIARSLNLSLRNMQRKLQEEKTNFGLVLANTRKDLANHYLSATSRPISDISFLLGFNEPSSFNRSYKRWAGKTPTEYRKLKQK